MEKQHGASSLLSLADNTLQDVAIRLDGHSLLALLRTCRDLHGSPALMACLFEAVLQQIAALEAALQAMLQALPQVEAILDCAEAVCQALPGGASDALAVTINLLRLETEHEAPESKVAAVTGLGEARAAVRAAQAAQQPGQQAQEAGQQLGAMVVQARQRATGTLEPGQQQEQLGQQALDVGPLLQQAMQRMLQALQLVPAQAVQAAGLEAVQAAERAVQVVCQAEHWQALQQAIHTVRQLAETGVGVEAAQQATRETLLALYQPLQNVVEAVTDAGQAVQQAVDEVQGAVEEGQEGLAAAVPALRAAAQELNSLGIRLFEGLFKIPVQVPQRIVQAALQMAVRSLLAGQPQVGRTGQAVPKLQALVSAKVQGLKRARQLILQQCVEEGEGRLQLEDDEVDEDEEEVDVQQLQAAVQAGQAMLQGLGDNVMARACGITDIAC